MIGIWFGLDFPTDHSRIVGRYDGEMIGKYSGMQDVHLEDKGVTENQGDEHKHKICQHTVYIV